jgi:hypothetical protein
MPDKENNKSVGERISENERFRYIGFDVFPGKPKDLFQSEEEKKKLVEAVITKRAKGEIIRDDCTLLEERVTGRDRFILALACIVIVATLFIPWYSAYNEIVEEVPQETSVLMPSDTAQAAAAGSDTTLNAIGETADTTPAATGTTTETQQQESAPAGVETESSTEQVIHGARARKKIHREYFRLSGIGAVLSLGSVGSYVFSSGFVLVLTGVIFIVYTLLCVVLPIYTLYGLFGIKGDPDERALRLKKILRFSWIPVVLFVLALFISFVGADYGFDTSALYTSLGSGYGVGVFLASLSWGPLVSLCAFILIAAKGIEI